MDILRLIILCGHLVGLSLLLGGFLIQLGGARKVNTPMVRGAEIQVATGILLVLVRELEDLPNDHWKLLTKFLIGLAALACARIGLRRPTNLRLFYATGILAAVNVVVAVFWH